MIYYRGSSLLNCESKMQPEVACQPLTKLPIYLVSFYCLLLITVTTLMEANVIMNYARASIF